MLFPPETRAELIRELETDEHIAGICVANGRTEEMLSKEFAADIYAQNVTVVVLWQKTDCEESEA